MITLSHARHLWKEMYHNLVHTTCKSFDLTRQSLKIDGPMVRMRLHKKLPASSHLRIVPYPLPFCTVSETCPAAYVQYEGLQDRAIIVVYRSRYKPQLCGRAIDDRAANPALGR